MIRVLKLYDSPRFTHVWCFHLSPDQVVGVRCDFPQRDCAVLHKIGMGIKGCKGKKQILPSSDPHSDIFSGILSIYSETLWQTIWAKLQTFLLTCCLAFWHPFWFRESQAEPSERGLGSRDLGKRLQSYQNDALRITSSHYVSATTM